MPANRLLFPVSFLVVLVILISACGGAPEVALQPTEKAAEPTEIEQTTVAEPTEIEPAEEADVTEVESVECPESVVADPKGVPAGEFPQQYELDEYELLTNCILTFSESPMLAEQVTAGILPPVEERLPEEPLVIQPYEEIGIYGGTMNGMSTSFGSATQDFMSWRHVNLLHLSDDLITVTPNVAKSWEWINDDYTAVEIKLRKGHKWSDGQPFTADDILFWWEDIINNTDLTPTIPFEYTFGGEPMKLEKVDDLTVRFTTAVPAPNILILFGLNKHPLFAPKHYMAKYHPDYNSDAEANAVADGYSKWTDKFLSVWNQWSSIYGMGTPHLESHIVVESDTEHRHFVRNPYYFKVDTIGQQLPYIDEHNEKFISDTEVRNLAIMRGQIDLRAQSMTLADFPLLKEHEDEGNYRVLTVPETTMVAYSWNVTSKDPVLRQIFEDVRWKEAMSIAINRDEINEAIYYGTGKPMQYVPIDYTLPFIKEEWLTKWIEYDPERANMLLDDMELKRGSDGWRLRPDGKVLTIYNQYAQIAGPVRIQELLAEYWKAVGIKVELKEVSADVYRSITSNNDHDFALYGGMSIDATTAATNPYRAAPVFGDRALSPFTGLPWLEWKESGGAKGEEPPAKVKRIFELIDMWTTLELGSEEWISVAEEICQLRYETMYQFGTVGGVPWTYVVNNRIHNVPTYTSTSVYLYWHWPYRVDQYFIMDK